MTPQQQRQIAHALGIPEHPWRKGSRARRWAYRNHFCAGPVDEPSWRDLEARGFAKCVRAPAVSEPVFVVTIGGVIAAGLCAYVPIRLVGGQP